MPGNPQEVVRYYEGLYFKNYQLHAVKEHVSESKILQQFHAKAKVKLTDSTTKYIKEGVEVAGKFFNAHFEYAWQNGSYNLVSPLSFDLQKEESIKKKVQQQIGVVSNLEDKIRSENLLRHALPFGCRSLREGPSPAGSHCWSPWGTECWPDHFIRISRSVIVNRRHIASATKLFGKRYEISVRDTKGSTVETGSRYVENFLGIL